MLESIEENYALLTVKSGSSKPCRGPETGGLTIDGKWAAFQHPDIEMIIDLKKPVNIDSISATFMHNPQLQVNLPEYIKYAVSNDGKNFTDIGKANNIWPGMGVKKELKKFVLRISGNVTTRFIKMNFKIVNSAYNDGNIASQSMLCDEIIVQ